MPDGASSAKPDSPSDRTAAPGPRPEGQGRTWPLRLHLFALALATLLPALAAGAFAAREAVMGHRTAFELRLLDTAKALAVALDAELRTLRTMLDALASANELEPGGDLAGFHARRSVTAREFGMAFVFVGPPPDYRRLFDTRRPFGAPLVAGLRAGPDNKPLLRAFETGQPQPVGIRQDLYGDWVTGTILPVRREGRVIGALVGLIDPARLSALIARPEITERGFAVLVDHEGKIVAHSPRADPALGQPIPPSMLERHLVARGTDLAFGPSREGVEMVVAAVPLTAARGWRLALMEPVDSYYAAWRRPLAILGLGGLAAILLAGLVAVLLARRLEQPVAALARHAAATAAEAAPVGAVPIPDAGVSEFAALRKAQLEAAATLRRRRAEARAGRVLLQSVIEALPDAVFVRDADGRYQLVNRVGLAMLGSSAAQTIGQVHGFALPPELRSLMQERHARVRLSGTPERSEEERRLPDGRLRRFETLTVPWAMPDAPGAAGTIGVSRDVTEQRRLEAELLRAESMLTELVRRATVSALASGLSHELNQPLAAATNYIGAAARFLDAGGDGEAPELAREALDAAGAQIRRAGEIIRRLRDFMAGLPLAARPEDPAAVVTEAVRLARAAMPSAQSIPVLLDLPEGIPAVPMDRVQVQQVLVNLLRNAFEALVAQGPTGGPAEVRLSLREMRDEGRLDIALADTGPGLPQDLPEGGFAPLRTTKPDGMGLGLAICRDIARAHGGSLRGGPGPGGTGTEMVLSLPLARDEATAPA